MPKDLSLEPKSSYDEIMPGAPLPIPDGDLEVADNNENFYALATKNFIINALTVNKPCHAGTTENLTSTYNNGTAGVGATLTSTSNEVFSVDGITPSVNDRILVKDQTSAFQNGIYAVTNAGSGSTSWVLTRATDYDSPSEITQGCSVSIVLGTLNQFTSWMQTSSAVTVGTTAITFARMEKVGIDIVTALQNQINVSIVDNLATLSFSEDMILPGTGAVTLPAGSTAQRPSTVRPGMVRFNNGS